jgi:transposase InsO family protein
LLCKLSWVSESWYYKYRKRKILWKTKEDKESEDMKNIRTLALKYNRKHWYRIITMLLKSQNITMNHKKVLRLMSKYNLLAIIRKKNPYKQIWKRTQEHRTCLNILNREFRWAKPFKKLWTDITYLYYNWLRCYLSILKDMITWEIISYKLSSNLGIWFVLHTIKEAHVRNFKWIIIHSDQWFHYTNPEYQSLLKNLWVVQSMSRKWNCLDNAPTESFFWHLKDDIDLSHCKNLKDVENLINNYIFYYNNKRPQWSRKKMTPVQYRNHLLQN